MTEAHGAARPRDGPASLETAIRSGDALRCAPPGDSPSPQARAGSAPPRLAPASCSRAARRALRGEWRGRSPRERRIRAERGPHTSGPPHLNRRLPHPHRGLPDVHRRRPHVHRGSQAGPAAAAPAPTAAAAARAAAAPASAAAGSTPTAAARARSAAAPRVRLPLRRVRLPLRRVWLPLRRVWLWCRRVRLPHPHRRLLHVRGQLRHLRRRLRDLRHWLPPAQLRLPYRRARLPHPYRPRSHRRGRQPHPHRRQPPLRRRQPQLRRQVSRVTPNLYQTKGRPMDGIPSPGRQSTPVEPTVHAEGRLHRQRDEDLHHGGVEAEGAELKDPSPGRGFCGTLGGIEVHEHAARRRDPRAEARLGEAASNSSALYAKHRPTPSGPSSMNSVRSNLDIPVSSRSARAHQPSSVMKLGRRLHATWNNGFCPGTRGGLSVSPRPGPWDGQFGVAYTARDGRDGQLSFASTDGGLRSDVGAPPPSAERSPPPRGRCATTPGSTQTDRRHGGATRPWARAHSSVRSRGQLSFASTDGGLARTSEHRPRAPSARLRREAEAQRRSGARRQTGATAVRCARGAGAQRRAVTRSSAQRLQPWGGGQACRALVRRAPPLPVRQRSRR